MSLGTKFYLSLRIMSLGVWKMIKRQVAVPASLVG
jgi:hypothetical protein